MEEADPKEAEIFCEAAVLGTMTQCLGLDGHCGQHGGVEVRMENLRERRGCCYGPVSQVRVCDSADIFQ